jgi:hypothetical protein
MLVICFFCSFSPPASWRTDSGPQALTTCRICPVYFQQAGCGLTQGARFGSQVWMVVYTIIYGVGIGVLAPPALAVRFMTSIDRELHGPCCRRRVHPGHDRVAFVVGALSNAVSFRNSACFGGRRWRP